MIWKIVEKIYGKEIASKMKKSPYLQGITVSITKDGETDYPESDIELAFKDIKKEKIYNYEWD